MHNTINLNYKVFKPFGNLYRERTCLILIKDQDNNILLATKDDYPDDIWRFIGGGIDKGEIPDIGALRELEEELLLNDLTVGDLKFLAEYKITAIDEAMVQYNHSIFGYSFTTNINLKQFEKNELKSIMLISANDYKIKSLNSLNLRLKFNDGKNEYLWEDFIKVYHDVQMSMIEIAGLV
jgi:ADP-ribose pyrophosphatase YjhB (NUDIX family)